MSRLHVKQIEGYLNTNLASAIDMSDYAHHSSETQLSRAFLTRALAVLATSHLTETPLVELSRYVTDGPRDGGIDLIYFSPSELTLYLTQTKWHENGRGSIELGDALKFIEGVKKVLENDVSTLNEKVQSKQSDIERAVLDANAKFTLVLAHTGQEDLSDEVEATLSRYINEQNDTSELMSLRVLKQFDIHKTVAAGLSGTPVSEEVHLYGWSQVREPHYAVYGQVCASDVASWMKRNGNRLFEKNLRRFLGTSLVNRDMVATLLNRPEDFWYFNNGITAIASSIAKKPIGGNSSESAIFECDGFFVVNGAQTVGSIFDASTNDLNSLDKARVPVRIISNQSDSSYFASEVTRYTNTQNAIEKRDFVALDPEQERIQQELRIEGVEYAFKSGRTEGSTVNRFDLTEATIALACRHNDVAVAVQAKREISKLWEDLTKPPYKQLFNSSVTGPGVWEAVQLLRGIDRALAAAISNRSGRERLVCVHGNRFIQWATLRSLDTTPNQTFNNALSDVPNTVQSMIFKVTEAVTKLYPDSYPASLFKNLSKCKILASNI